MVSIRVILGVLFIGSTVVILMKQSKGEDIKSYEGYIYGVITGILISV